MKIFARKNLSILILASLNDNQILYEQHEQQIRNDLGDHEIDKRIAKMLRSDYIELSNGKYNLTEKGRIILERVDM